MVVPPLADLLLFSLALVAPNSACDVADFARCAKASHQGFKPPTHKTVDAFCWDYRLNVSNCLTKRRDPEATGSAHERAELLLRCAKTSATLVKPEEAELAKRNARFFTAACVFNNIADVHKKECFDFLMKDCLGDDPPQECFYSDCPKMKWMKLSERANSTAEPARSELKSSAAMEFSILGSFMLLVLAFLV
ncbi:hypothetical protein L596_028648 [Steinernema carpocapsae]|uniref:Secreted protein n=1 Tax=Steinernema carpocapsae TaxID=34508 RepID=A0A4U5M018_STECR|nr:hypothetical protein L596_028648 [Steinernema carpocapsae]